MPSRPPTLAYLLVAQRTSGLKPERVHPPRDAPPAGAAKSWLRRLAHNVARIVSLPLHGSFVYVDQNAR
jgi:hypothetical protein